MSKHVLFATMIAVAAPALAQSGGAASAGENLTPPPEFITAAQAFGQCVGTKVRAVPTTVTPEATAHQAVVGCAAEKAALTTSFETWVAGPGFPADKRAMAREQFTAQMTGLEPQITSQIREGRAQAATPAPAPVPSPAPSPTPTAPR